MIRQKSSKIVYENQWIRVREDEVQFPDGHESIYAYTERRDAGPMIVAVTSEGNLVLLREWRYPIKDWTYCLPFGGVEDGEDDVTAAKRELEEETGYTAANWQSMGVLKIDPGANAQVTPVFLATGLQKGQTHLDSGEVHKVVEMSPAEIKAKIKRGEIDNGWLLAGFMKYAEFVGKCDSNAG